MNRLRVYERGSVRRELWLEGAEVCAREGEEALERERCELELAAKWALDRRAHAWLEEGFVRVDAGEEQALDDGEFIAALRREPEELANFLVYGDWLSERDSPHGQLIALHCAMAQLPRFGAGKQRDVFARQEVMIMFQHAAQLWGRLGEIVDEDSQQFGFNLLVPEWQWGFVRRARVPELGGRMALGQLAEGLAVLPIAALLEQLEFVQMRYEPGQVATLAAQSWPCLHTLDLRRDHTLPPNYWDDVVLQPFDANELVALLSGRAPRLHTLAIELCENSLALAQALVDSPITPQLRVLRIVAEDLDLRFVNALRQAPFAALERLRLEGPDIAHGAKSRLRELPGQVEIQRWRLHENPY